MQDKQDTAEVTVEAGAVVLDGRFQVLSEIGKGGMGAVFLAKQLSTGKQVAVKFIHAHNLSEKLLVRFKKEAGFMSSLSHPNLVTLLDYGVDADGSPFLVMDYIEGEAMSSRLKREPNLTDKELLSIFLQIAKSLSYLHSKKIIHRDLKPSNIVLLQDVDGEPLVKLLDLGIAKALPEDGAGDTSDITDTGDVVGSPAYMSPEQAMGQQLDVRSDIFSLGCMMYQSLTGRMPFKAETPVAHISQRLMNDALPISEATAAPQLVPVVMKCLARDREQRYADANELIEVLRRISESSAISTAMKRSDGGFRKFSSRSIWITVGLVACIGFGTYSVLTEQDRKRGVRDRLFAEHQFAAVTVARDIVEADKRDRNVNEGTMLNDTIALAKIEHDMGSVESSSQAYRDALNLPATSTYPVTQANILLQLAINSIERDDPRKGIELLDEAQKICAENNLTRDQVAAQVASLRGKAQAKLSDQPSVSR